MVAPGAVTAAGGPGRSLIASGLVGLGVELLLLPAILLIASALTLSVVGIPLLAGIPILLLFVAAAAVVGFTAVAGRLGGLWRWGGRAAPLANVVSGLVLILATGLTGRYMWAASGGDSTLGALLALVGLAIEYACWTIGLGSATLALVSRRARRMPATAAVVPPPIAADAS
jgi:hypothetical protein